MSSEGRDEASALEGHAISVSGDKLTFSAAHMATMGDDLEPLHGHSYAVTVEARGPLTADGWVWDFSDLRRTTAEILATLDHRFVLQTSSTKLDLANRDGRWTIKHGAREYILPESDVAALPIDNSTAEQLAEWICRQLQSRLTGQSSGLTNIRVGVSEGPGQAGWYTVHS